MDIVELMKHKTNVYHLNAASDEDIIDCENKLNLRFSMEYIEYLKTFSLLSYESHELTGICKSERLNVVNSTQREKAENKLIPSDMYLIECVGVENVTIWQKENGEIYEVSYKNEPHKIFNSLKEYIEHT